jgi:hypothetical protein
MGLLLHRGRSLHDDDDDDDVIAPWQWPEIKAKKLGTKYRSSRGPKHGVARTVGRQDVLIYFQRIVVLTVLYVPECNKPPLIAFLERYGDSPSEWNFINRCCTNFCSTRSFNGLILLIKAAESLGSGYSYPEEAAAVVVTYSLCFFCLCGFASENVQCCLFHDSADSGALLFADGTRN